MFEIIIIVTNLMLFVQLRIAASVQDFIAVYLHVRDRCVEGERFCIEM